MADRIRLLPDPVANQIAAGEVVNRPSSVVKELVENAVDAGSRQITVNFRDGGKTFIQVIDDGCGMSPSDARLAFDRHATSKIVNVEDIYSLSTFGFRGEALASIASVAEVELRTRQPEDEVGSKVEISGGRFVSQTPTSCPAGTQFMIRNLFYNIPARRRFLEKSTTESRHITTEFNRIALCNPSIAFSLYDSDSLISKLTPSGLRQRIISVAGKNIAKNLIDISADTSIVKLEGFVGRPASARQSNREQYMFVNGRYFKSQYFHKAIVSAYDKIIPANTQPSYFIYLTIDPARIDVNVHPQKTEVKFTDGSDMWHIINAAVRETLAKSGAVPPMDFDLDPTVEIPVLRERAIYKAPEIRGNPEFNPFERYSGEEENNNLPDGCDIQEDDDILPASRINIPDSARCPDSAPYGKSSSSVARPGATALEPGQGNVSDFMPDYIPGDEHRPWNILKESYPENSFPHELHDGQPGSASDEIFANDENLLDSPSISAFDSILSSEDGNLGESILDFADDEEGVQGTLELDCEDNFEGYFQATERYMVTRHSGNLVVIDLQRAQQAILFDRYMSMLGNGSSISQKLLFPEVVTMSTDDCALMEENIAEFHNLGFELKLLDSNTIQVEGLPAEFPAGNLEQALYDLLDTIRDETSDTATGKRKEIATAMATIGAHKSSRMLDKTEAESVLTQLSLCSNPSFTPDGKPVMAMLTENDLKNLLQ